MGTKPVRKDIRRMINRIVQKFRLDRSFVAEWVEKAEADSACAEEQNP